MTEDDNPQVPKPFLRRAFIEEPELIGARWWQESVRSAQRGVSRRRALRNILMIGGAVGAAGLLISILGRGTDDTDDDDDEIDVSRDALELQKEHGWDFGEEGGTLAFPGSVETDSQGGRDWAAAIPALAADLAPSQPELRPYYVPTLFQSLAAPSSSALRATVRPIHDAAMETAFDQGKALAELFNTVLNPRDTAVLLDVPGSIAVAAAAGMADRFEPVFLFDNWPHPAGVVPAHLPLAAALYYRPRLVAAAAQRSAATPAVFVLDSQRLADYVETSSQFDNRYVAKLPTAANLQSLGAKHVLYVVADGSAATEKDDLNDDFVALAAAGIDVKMVALDDFKPGAEPVAADVSSSSAPMQRHYYWGGHPGMHVLFWPTYGWYRPSVAVPSLVPPAPLPRTAQYRPAPRPTMFSTRTVGGGVGVGKQKPSGFGRVSVRTSRTTGVVTGRSGSFTRSGSSSSG